MGLKIELNTDVEMLTGEHDGHMLNANVTFYDDGGVARCGIWCNSCKRYLVAKEATIRSSSSVFEQ